MMRQDGCWWLTLLLLRGQLTWTLDTPLCQRPTHWTDGYPCNPCTMYWWAPVGKSGGAWSAVWFPYKIKNLLEILLLLVLIKLKATLPALRSQNLIAAVEPPGPFRNILKIMNIVSILILLVLLKASLPALRPPSFFIAVEPRYSWRGSLGKAAGARWSNFHKNSPLTCRLCLLYPQVIVLALSSAPHQDMEAAATRSMKQEIY